MAIGERYTRSRVISLVAFVVGVLLFLQLWRSFGAGVDFSTLSTTDWLLILALPVPAFLVMLMRLQLILEALGAQARPVPLLGSLLASHAVGYLLPGGTLTELAARTFFLTQAGLTIKQSVLANTIDGLVRFAVNSIVLFVVAVYFVGINFGDPGAQLAVVAGLLLSLLGLVILFVVLFSGIDRWFVTIARRITRRDDLDTTFAEWKQDFLHFFRLHPMTVVWTSLLTILGFLLEPLQLLILLRLLGIDLPLWAIFYLYQALTLPRILPVPAGLGVSEQGGVLFSDFVSNEAGQGFTLSLLWRARLLPYLVFGLLLLPVVSLLRVQKPTRVDS